MPNPDVFFGILQGYGEASRAQEQKVYDEEKQRRQTLADFWMKQSQRQDIRPEARDVATQNYIGIVQTPMHKKLGKELESVQDFLKVPVQPQMGSPMWQGGQTTRGITAENMPIPSSFPGAAPQPVQTGPLSGQGIQPPPVAPPSMGAASGTTTPPPSTFQAPVPSPPPGYTVRAPAMFTPEEQYKKIEETGAATGRGKAATDTAEYTARKKFADENFPGANEDEKRAFALGRFYEPKPPTPDKPPNMGVVRGFLNGQRVIADRDPKTGKLYFQGQEVTGGFTPDQTTSVAFYRDAESSSGWTEAKIGQQGQIVGLTRGIQPSAAQVGTITTRQIHRFFTDPQGNIHAVPITETTERTPISGGPAELPTPGAPTPPPGGPPISTLPGASAPSQPGAAPSSTRSGIGPGQGGTVGARPLTPDQAIKEGQRGGAYAVTIERMVDVLAQVQDPKFNFKSFLQRAKLQTVTDPSGFTRTIVANIPDLSDEEAKFAADFNSLAEDINILRSAFGATISRGETMLHILQSQRGQLMGNPKVFEEQLKNSLQSALSQIGPVQQGLSRVGRPMELNDNMLRAYLIMNKNDEQKALQALKRDGWTVR